MNRLVHAEDSTDRGSTTISPVERTSEEGRNATNPRKELVREQLIDIAAELFDRKGYAQTNINDIARAIGLGRSAVYHYFRNKEEILAALVEAEAFTPLAQLQHLSSHAEMTPTQRLRHAIIGGIERRLGSGSRSILLSRLESQIPDDLAPLYNKSRREILNFYVDCISEGTASGEFRMVDPKIAAFAVIGMANWTSRWFSPQGALSPIEIGEIIADIALHGLVARDSVVRDDVGIGRALDEMRKQIDLVERRLR